MTSKPKPLRFVVPGPPVGLQHHRSTPKHGKHYTPAKSKAYMRRCGMYALTAMAAIGVQDDWPYEGDVYLDLYIYHIRKHPRPDPENVAAAIQDGCTGVLWENDNNVLPRIQSHWWPGKNDDGPPGILVENDKYLGGVCCVVRRIA